MPDMSASEIETKIAVLENMIKELKEQQKQMAAESAKPVEKAAPAQTPVSEEEQKKEEREKYIQSIMEKTGWSREETVKRVSAARKKVGITYKQYDRYNFHTVPADQQEDEYMKRLEVRPAKTKKERKAKKNEKLIHTVMHNTGWDYQTAKDTMDRSQKLCGAEYKDYVAYRFWELDEEIQKTYFTKGHANALRKKYNTNKENVSCFMNKNEFDEVFSDFLGRPWAHVPKVTLEEFKEKFAGEEKIIYKPLSDSCGHGVTVFDLNADNLKSVYDILVGLPEGVVEGYVKQHPEMSKFSRKSVNTVRIVSVYDFGKVNILYAAFRMGGGDAVVDNFHAGGVLALINPETGIVETNAIDLGGTFFEKHPVTGEKILGFQIPFWSEIVEMLQKAGRIVEGVRYVGWDVAVTEKGPILIEGNTAPAPNVLQTPYAKEHKGMYHVVEKYL